MHAYLISNIVMSILADIGFCQNIDQVSVNQKAKFLRIAAPKEPQDTGVILTICVIPSCPLLAMAPSQRQTAVLLSLVIGWSILPCGHIDIIQINRLNNED